ncbi:MAG: CHAP domain-containing protein [Acetobacteraceae bacterium]|nr:CHAP domain-containing protein [Acetobacteraceae bacterium]
MALGVAVSLGAPLACGDAEAAQPGYRSTAHEAATGAQWGQVRGEYAVPAEFSRRGISCVPFARENSGIEIRGNALTWWGHAAGVYARGNRPEVGSVLNFRATRHMRLGHVAVVTDVLTPRVVEIDHANWSARGKVSRGIRVVDVSPANDWSQVRVALARSSDGYGSVYPTYGFIYDRPDDRVLLADARRGGEQTEVDEIAELPDNAMPRFAHGSRHWHHHHRYHYHD